MQRTIDESRFVEAGVFRREALQRLQDEHVGGQFDHNYRLWMVFNLEMFWRHYLGHESVSALEGWIDDARHGARPGAADWGGPTTSDQTGQWSTPPL